MLSCKVFTVHSTQWCTTGRHIISVLFNMYVDDLVNAKKAAIPEPARFVHPFP